MKAENLVLYGLIDGKRKPKSLEAYLQVLVDDLQHLLQTGIQVYDAATDQVFSCKAMLMTSLQDYIGYRDVGCQKVSGDQPRLLLSPVPCMQSTLI